MNVYLLYNNALIHGLRLLSDGSAAVALVSGMIFYNS